MKPSKITGIILHSIVKITKVSFYSNKIRSFSTSAMIPRTKQFQVEGLSTTHGGTETSTSECKFPPLQILYDDSDFVVVDKPHSLRMDGDDFDDSLQKRLIAQLGGSKDSYKWVHQLDFATSGVICVAKTRQAAAIARSVK
jgi:23S rRNA-/tRNA-specific pseudouridylate synthase